MAPGSRSEGLTMMVLPVMVAMGMDQRGIMAGKSGCDVSLGMCCERVQGLTEGTYHSCHAQRLFIRPRLHIFAHLQNLACKLRGDAARCLRNLKTSEDISSCIRKCLSLLQCDARCQSIPVLADQMHEFEHDLLPAQQARSSPPWKGFLRAFHRCTHLFICRLWDAGDEVVCGGVVEVDPLGGSGGLELVVHEVLGIFWRRDLFMRGWVGVRCACAYSCIGLLVPGRGMDGSLDGCRRKLQSC